MKNFFVLVLFTFVFTQLQAQYVATDTRHFFKLEGGYLVNYLSTLSEDTKELRLEQSGRSASLSFGWDFDEKKALSVGAGYLSLDKLKGIDAFTEIHFYVSNGYVNPYLGAKLGYSVIWPIDSDGQGDLLAEFVTGIKIRLGMYSYPSFYVQSGLLYTQKTLYFPLRLGFSF